MNITTNDVRPLAVCLIDPKNGNAFNWSNGQWGTFNPAIHLAPLSGVPNLPPVFSSLQTAFIQNELISRPDTVATILTVDNSGNPLSLNDVWTAPFPLPLGNIGGFSR